MPLDELIELADTIGERQPDIVGCGWIFELSELAELVARITQQEREQCICRGCERAGQ